ncbi:uncharacterized protein LOC125490068 [Plutella xylostella]|uniref:uncharacterized protein LOC125490068 n=1 Tax=Plutella xylostella TaxID=51655 RepID=UPI0020330D8E|nr:uncharacterized protein LOC125490068 [Plutella xylostella]
MEDFTGTEKIIVCKAKSCAAPDCDRLLKRQTARQKSFNSTEVTKPLATARLKKSKLGDTSTPSSPVGRVMTPIEIHMDNPTFDTTTFQGIDSGSVLSMNFSHYEMMRNLSQPNASVGAFSGPQHNSLGQPNEQLERYFRSVELWNKMKNLGPTTETQKE